MRRPVAKLRNPMHSVNRGRVASVISRPAPVKGWNARDPIASMKPDEAIYLENLFPSATDVMLRKGIASHVTGIAGQVESLMAYNRPDGADALFAAAVDSIYDVTTAGAVGAAVVAGLSNGRWNHVNFTNSSGTSYLCCFNGVDSPRYYDGTNWITITGASTPAITGLTTSGIVSAAINKRRMWLVQKDSLKAWYLPVDSVGGAAAAIDLSGIAKLGGYIMAIGAWTMDAGEGIDDYWVAITSEGEVVVYAGTDPSSASTWSLKGVWQIGRPICRRCMVKFGGDLLLILVNGVFPLSKALLSSNIDPRIALTDKINTAMIGAASLYSGNYGWQLQHYSNADMLLLNVPVNEGDNQEQYVMNVVTGAWCQFTGIEANCFEAFQGELYFGGSTIVSKAWSGYSDNGANITGSGKTAFDYFGTKTKKSWKMARPIISSNGTPTVEIGINPDYSDGDDLGTLTFSASSAGLWGVALWGGALWASSTQTLKNWIGLSGIGLCAATRFKTSAQGLEIRWQATDHLFESGDGVV